jgi:hypothetical protein
MFFISAGNAVFLIMKSFEKIDLFMTKRPGLCFSSYATVLRPVPVLLTRGVLLWVLSFAFTASEPMLVFFQVSRQFESHRKEDILSATKQHHDYIQVQLKAVHMSVWGEYNIPLSQSPAPLRRAGTCKRGFAHTCDHFTSSGRLPVSVTQKAEQLAAEGNNSISDWCTTA